jgi:hypothetical protein
MSHVAQPVSSPLGSPQGSPSLHALAGVAQGSPPPLDLAAAHEQLKLAFNKQNDEGHALMKAFNELKAEKAALKQKLERGGAGKMLQQVAKFTGQGGVPLEEFIDENEKNHVFFHIGETEKVETAVMLLKGAAAHWWKTLVTKGEATKDWGEFVEKMKEMFQPISSVDRARAALDNCIQGKRSVQAYTDAFRRLIQFLPDMNEGDQKHRYTTNLNDTIRVEVLKAKAKNLEEAIHAAVSAEAYGSRSKAGYLPLGQYYPASRYGNSASTSSSTPMEVSNINFGQDEDDESMVPPEFNPTALPPPPTEAPSTGNSQVKYLLNQIKALKAEKKVQASLLAMYNPRSANASRVPGVSKADYERCRKEGRCLNCKKKGHVARECTNPATSNY